MARKPMPGLIIRKGIWHIEKRCKYAPNGRLRESTKKSNLEEAEACLVRRLAELEAAAIHGKAIEHTFEEAAAKYVSEYSNLASIADNAAHLNDAMPFVGHLFIGQVDDEAIQEFVKHELNRGLRPKSINNKIGVIARVLNLCARKWRDKVGDRKVPWLQTVPLLERLPVHAGNSAQPYPLDWNEQAKLFNELPAHLQAMAIYKVNVGCREQEVCQLQWEWEAPVSELDTFVFIVPAWLADDDLNTDNAEGLVKNREDRLHILNRNAISVIRKQRAERPKDHMEKCQVHLGQSCNCAYTYVFHYKGYRVSTINNNGWRSAWRRAGLPTSKRFLKGVHNLKHTCGRRLRAAGVPEKTRKVILGHTVGDITTHYSAAEIAELLDAVSAIAVRPDGQTPTLTVLKSRRDQHLARCPQNDRTVISDTKKLIRETL